MTEFETTQCSKCDGAGRLPYTVDRGKCFKCSGSGRVLTPTGRAAKKRHEAQLDKLLRPWASVQPGDTVQIGGRWAVVESRGTSPTATVQQTDGTEKPLTRFETSRGSISIDTDDPDKMVRVWAD